MAQFVAFDIETLGSLENTAGVTCASTCTSDGDHRVWTGPMIPTTRMYSPTMGEHLHDMVIYLARLKDGGYDVVSWNGLSFDWRIIQEQLPSFAIVKRLCLTHIDPALHMLSEKGYMCGLNAAAQGFGLGSKLEGMDGKTAAEMWITDRKTQNTILEYVAQDAKLTRDVFAAATKAGALYWKTRAGKTSVWQPEGGAFLSVEAVLEKGFVGRPSWWSGDEYPWIVKDMTEWLDFYYAGD